MQIFLITFGALFLLFGAVCIGQGGILGVLGGVGLFLFGGFFLFLGIHYSRDLEIQEDEKKKAIEYEKYLKDNGFEQTTSSKELRVDSIHKKWIIDKFPKIYDYRDLADYELIIDGEKAAETGTALNAAIGGALFGMTGAVIGATTGKVINSIDSMYINIYTKDGDIRKIYYIMRETDKNSMTFKNAKLDAEHAISILYKIKCG